MESMTAAEFWSLVSSIVSTILAIGAIALSLYFFVASKRTEREAAAALMKIETQTEMLQKLTGKQLDRLTRFVTTERQDPTTEVTRLLLSFTELTKPLSASIPPIEASANVGELQAELRTCYIAIYYYAAISNFWSQLYLPAASEFDDTNEFHRMTRQSVDMSATDFNYLAGILARCNQQALAVSPLAHLLTETKDRWRHSVRPAADVFIVREKRDE